jgi:hypothetical protein
VFHVVERLSSTTISGAFALGVVVKKTRVAKISGATPRVLRTIK